MNKSTLSAAVGLALAGASLTAQAALTTTSVLAFSAGNVGTFTSAAAAGSSYHTWVVDTNGTTLYFGMQAGTEGGIHIGAAQTTGTYDQNTALCSPAGAACSHPGLPYDIQYPTSGYTTDHGPIDMGWAGLFSNTGLHFTTTGPTVVTDSGFTKTLDFSGWRMTWNSIPTVDLGGGNEVIGSITYNNGTGLATITCSTSACSNSSSFTLDYVAVVPQSDPSGLAGGEYTLHLSGIVNAVPVPAAAWLFGSGLMGLVAAGRRRRCD